MLFLRYKNVITNCKNINEKFFSKILLKRKEKNKWYATLYEGEFRDKTHLLNIVTHLLILFPDLATLSTDIAIS